MTESVAVAKEADVKKGVSPTRSDNSIHRVRNEPEMQIGSLRSVIDNIRRDGGTPSVDSIATELSSMHATQRASVLLALQQTHGNRYVQRVVVGIQAKLKLGQPGDIYEQEADRVAEEVMRMPEPKVQRQSEEEEEKKKEEEEELIQTKPIADQITPSVQRQVKNEEEEEEILQTKGRTGQTPEVTPDLESRINALRGGGQPLPRSVRNFFEPRFGRDFGQVRIRTDGRAAETAEALNAQAYTLGQDIVFGPGQYAPGTTSGNRLLAHELTHVVQQTGQTTSFRSAVKQRSNGPLIQERWRLPPTAASREWSGEHVDPGGTFFTPLGRYHRARVEYSRFLERGVEGKVETRQLPLDITRGGTASLRMWKYTRYTFNHDGDDNNLLELTINANLTGGAKAEDCPYARGGAAIFGIVKVRTPDNPSPDGTELFDELREGGESACSRVPAGELEVIVPIDGGSARLRIPLERTLEGALADFGRSLPLTTHEVSGMPGGWPIVDVYLGAYIETAADIESGIVDIAWDRNWSRATAEYNLSWSELTLPQTRTLEAAPEEREPAPVRPQSAAPYRMRFQVQWGSRSGGPTFSEVRTADAAPGVRTGEAVSALNAVVAQVTPRNARRAAEPAKQRQIRRVNNCPPNGITDIRSWSEYFTYRNYTDARVDIENQRGHNLRV